jgi:molybdenum-dependent DNA-binding transcriptional regulator ModE
MADRPSPDVELRVKPGGTVAFGPTQADLLEAILLTGAGKALIERYRAIEMDTAVAARKHLLALHRFRATR